MRINIQPIEKPMHGAGSALSVHSIFYTIQGEGPHCGRPAVFIRLAGCNLQCPMCDTDYTEGRMWMPVNSILRHVTSLMQVTGTLVVITGGEPFRQNITPLCDALVRDLGVPVQVETNGTLSPSPALPEQVMIVCSPKTGKINPLIAKRATCFKYVMSHTSVAADGLPGLALGHTASPHVARPPDHHRKIYLQPMDAQDEEENKKNIQAVVQSCMAHGYTLQLQIHKLLNLE